MYIINEFVFGFDLNDDLELKQLFSNIDLEYSEKIDKKDYEISSPYHGSCMSLKDCPILFGVTITDDDMNDEYVNEIQSAKKEDYIDSFNEFIERFKKDSGNQYSEDEKVKYFDEYTEYTESMNNIIKGLEKLEPKFYSLQTTS